MKILSAFGKAAVLSSVLIFSGGNVCAYAQDAAAEAQQRKFDFEHVTVFPAVHNIHFLKNSGEYTRRELTEAEVLKAEGILTSFILSRAKDQRDSLPPAYVRQLDEIVPKFFEYGRQYFGITRTADGHNCVWINCFLGPKNFPYWKDETVQMDDGGSAFFNIKIDLDAGQAYDLFINGEA